MNGGESENSNSSQELKQQLIQASGAGNLADVKHLVEVLNIQHDKCRDVDGCTPLNYASYYGHLHIVKYLVEEVKVNLRECKSSDGYNALHSAAYNGKLDVVRYLIEDQDMDTDVRDYDGHTALYWANNRGWTRVATYLSSFEKSAELADLVSELQEVNDWIPFGLYVGIKLPKLKAIEMDYHLISRCRIEMLSEWQKQMTPTWSAVVQALVAIGMRRLATELAQKHGIPPPKLPDNVPLDQLENIPHQDMKANVSEQHEEMQHRGDSGDLVVSPATGLLHLQPTTTPASTTADVLGTDKPPIRIDIKDVKYLGEKIGEGAFGSVEMVEVSGKIYAGKQYRKDCNFSEEMFIREFQIMQSLQHDHIVQYYGYHIHREHHSPVLIMECLETNLHDFLLSDSHKNLPLARKVDLLCGVAQGLNYLHSKYIIHRDLTASNVLLNSTAVPKISDFGNSCVTRIDSALYSQSLTKFPGTLNYMAPEAQSSTRYGTEIDIFSFGHLSLFVGTQTSPTDLLPFNDPDSDESDDDNVVRGRNEVQRRQKYFTLLCRNLEEKHSLVVLIKKCLHNRPKKRPKANELVVQLDTMSKKLPPPPPLNIMMKRSSTPKEMQK